MDNDIYNSPIASEPPVEPTDVGRLPSVDAAIRRPADGSAVGRLKHVTQGKTRSQPETAWGVGAGSARRSRESEIPVEHPCTRCGWRHQRPSHRGNRFPFESSAQRPHIAGHSAPCEQGRGGPFYLAVRRRCRCWAATSRLAVLRLVTSQLYVLLPPAACPPSGSSAPGRACRRSRGQSIARENHMRFEKLLGPSPRA